jgi:hypothetical protein
MRLKSSIRDQPDCGLGAAGDSAGFIEHAAFHHTFGAREGNGALEGQVAAGLDQGEVHAGSAWIGNYPLHSGDREIAFAGRPPPRLVIDDPVADELRRAAEILAGKLILLGWEIVVDRVLSMQEYASCHAAPRLGLCGG